MQGGAKEYLWWELGNPTLVTLKYEKYIIYLGGGSGI